MSFSGKAAIVTGGASGIGRALGAELLRHGAHVVLADVDSEGAEIAAKELASTAGDGGSVVGAHLDVRDAGAVQSLVDKVVESHGRLDLMFNNAGIVLGGRTHEMQSVHWDRVIDVNLNGVINGLLAAYPVMVAQGYGHIVNTASTAGLAPAIFVVAYSASKHAVVGLSAALRPEAAALGVRVSAICPGAVETPILDRNQPPDLPPRPSGTMTGRQYMRRAGFRFMRADRFARLALRGVARNKAIIIVPRSIRPVWYLQRLSPALMERIGRVMVRRIGRDL